jgi:hypothetical protein
MTREEFIQVLEKKGYRYRIEEDSLIVDHDGNVWLNNLTSLPAGVQFRNRGNVWLPSFTSLPADVQFKNGGYVWLNSLTSLPIKDLDYTFQNSETIYIEGRNMKVEFPESRWVPVKTRRVKTFESFTSDI